MFARSPRTWRGFGIEWDGYRDNGMFSGIVTGTGRLLRREELAGDRRLTIAVGDAVLSRMAPGCSIAVNGVCLTMVGGSDGEFSADVSLATLSGTTLGGLRAGDPVNLEGALRLNDTVDGHLVTGHVDGVGRVVSVVPEARSVRLRIAADAELMPYVARKGSVAVDGVSLTVNAADRGAFEVNIVPHTQEITIISGYRPGTAVNIEVDVVARYLERLAAAGLLATDKDA